MYEGLAAGWVCSSAEADRGSKGAQISGTCCSAEDTLALSRLTGTYSFHFLLPKWKMVLVGVVEQHRSPNAGLLEATRPAKSQEPVYPTAVHAIAEWVMRN